ncbi:hypothetical protein LIER_22550 [Lithospermum erythrorhizon]|uniref:Uncharacterized protein n=1 Tax=Lithospermum erythrorhizon TaxID=34254 RepID=A0AAV3QVV2_LITER
MQTEAGGGATSVDAPLDQSPDSISIVGSPIDEVRDILQLQRTSGGYGSMLTVLERSGDIVDAEHNSMRPTILLLSGTVDREYTPLSIVIRVGKKETDPTLLVKNNDRADIVVASETNVHSKNLKLSKNQARKNKQKEKNLLGSAAGSSENTAFDTSPSEEIGDLTMSGSEVTPLAAEELLANQMQPVINLERTTDVTESTTRCAEERSHDNVSDFFPSEAKRKKSGSIRKATTNFAGKSDEPVKDTSASLMVSQLLQQVAPKEDDADTGALDSEEADEVLDPHSVLISTSRRVAQALLPTVLFHQRVFLLKVSIFLPNGVRTALPLTRGWIKKEHPDSDFSALYLDKEGKDAEDNLDR